MNESLPATAAAGLEPRNRGQNAGPTAVPRQNGRAAALQWLRKTHGWFGLWGATLGLLFGTSGIWLNHRAVLKLPPVAQQRTNTEIALPEPAPADAQALAAWLQTALRLDAPATTVRVEAARPVPWAERPPGSQPRGERGEPGGDASGRRSSGGERSEVPPADPGRPGEPGKRGAGEAAALMQPEHWTINFGGPHATLQAETWAGNRSVSIRRVDNGVLATLTNLHKGIGMPVAWILLVDTLAGSLILLSLSGLVLWVMTHRRRAVGYAIFGLGCALTVGLAVSRM